MNEQPSPRVNSNQPDQPATSDLAQTLTARTEWVQQTLSPWTRRWLPAATGSNLPGRPRPVALTTAQTMSFLGHIQRAVEVASLWRVDTNALQPVRLDRFGAAVVNRFPDTSHRFELQPTPAQTKPGDLVLAGVAEAEAPQATPKYPAGFKPFSSFAEFQAALEAKEREAAASPPPSSSSPAPAATTPSTPPKPVPPPRSTRPPQLQRLPQLGQPPRQLPPGTRPRSKIEEVTPAGEPEPKPKLAEELFPPTDASEILSDQAESDRETDQPAASPPAQSLSEPAESLPLQRRSESEVPPSEPPPLQMWRRPDVPTKMPTQAGQSPSPRPIESEAGSHPSAPPKRVEELKPRSVSLPASETTQPPVQRFAEQKLPPVEEVPASPPADPGEDPTHFPPLPEQQVGPVQQAQIEPEPTRPDLSQAGETRFAPPLKSPQRPEQLPTSTPEPGQEGTPPVQTSTEPKPARPTVGFEPTGLDSPLPDSRLESTAPQPSEPELPPFEPERPEQAADLSVPPLLPSPSPSGETVLPPAQRFEESELTVREKSPVEPPLGPPKSQTSSSERLPFPPPEAGRQESSVQPAAKPGLPPEASPSIQRQPATPSFSPAPESPGLGSGGPDLPLVERHQPGTPVSPGEMPPPHLSEPEQIPASPEQPLPRPEPEPSPGGPQAAKPEPVDLPAPPLPASLSRTTERAVQRTTEPELTLREFSAIKPEQPEQEEGTASPPPLTSSEQKPRPTTSIAPLPTGSEPASLLTSQKQPPQPDQTLPPLPDLPQVLESERAGASTDQGQAPKMPPLPPVQRSEAPELTLVDRQQPYPPSSPADTPEQLAPPPPPQTPEKQPPGSPLVQHTSGLEMPIRETPPVESKTPKQAIEPEPPEQGVRPEASSPLPGLPPVQRASGLEMSLRETPPVEPEPAEKMIEPELSSPLPGLPPVQPALASEMPLREVPPIEPKGPEQATEPEVSSPLSGAPPVQRALGLEMPLREVPPVEPEPPGQGVGSAASSPLPEQPPVQRFSGLEMPLRETPPIEPKTPERVVEPEPAEKTIEPEPSSPLPGLPPVQRSLGLEMPLREIPPVERVQPQPAEDWENLPQPLTRPPSLKTSVPEEEKWLPVEDRPDLPASQAKSSTHSPATPEAVRPTGPTVQRVPEFEGDLPLSPRPIVGRQPDRTPLTDEPARPGGLDREILARATSSARMPLVEAGREANRASQGKVVQTRPMAALPQARGQTGPVEVSEADTWPDETALPFTSRPQPAAQAVETPPLPLVPPIRIEVRSETTVPPEVVPPQPRPSSPVSQVQRQLVDETVPVLQRSEPVAAPPSPAIIQREEKEEKETASDSSETKPAEPPDLDKLARQIYPLIKRMLAVERERRPIR